MVLAYLLITVEKGKERIAGEKLLHFPEVKNVHILFGEYDLIAKLQTENEIKLQRLITENIRSVEEITGTRTLIAADITKETDKI